MPTHDLETLAAYADRVDDYLALTGKDAPTRDVRNFINDCPAGGRVLDLGCGPGNAAAQMVAGGLQVDAWDASPEMVAAAQSHFGVIAKQATFADLSEQSLYDGVFANFSLLHATKTDFSAHLKRIKSALKRGGILHLGMKTGTGETRDSIGRFYAYYGESELIDLLTCADFRAEITRRGSALGLAGAKEPFVIVRAYA